MSFRANRFFNRGLHAGLRLLGTDSVSLPSGLVTIAKKCDRQPGALEKVNRTRRIFLNNFFGESRSRSHTIVAQGSVN